MVITTSRRIARVFDNSKPLLFGRDANVEGRDVKAGDLVAGNLAAPIRMKLWLMGRAHYEDQYELMTRRAVNISDADRVTIVEGKGGWFTIDAPWLDDPIKVRGQQMADEEFARVRDAGEPLSFRHVTIESVGGGWWAIKADWLDVEEKARGEESARVHANALRRTGPPDEWDGEPVPLARQEPETDAPTPEPEPAVLPPAAAPPATPEAEAPPVEGEPAEGDLVAFGDPRTIGKIMLMLHGQAAVQTFTPDGQEASRIVKTADMAVATDEDRAAFAGAQRANAAARGDSPDARQIENL